MNGFSLALLGASVRSAAQSAVRAGLQPVGADLFADCDLDGHGRVDRITNYPHDFIRWLGQTPCDGWSYTGGLENYPALIKAMAATRPLLGCDGNVLNQVRSPMKLATALTAAGLPFPKTIPLTQEGPSPKFTTQGPWLLKTGRGSGGSGVRNWAHRARGSQFSHLHSSRLPKQGYLQQAIAGPSFSALYVASAGQAKLLGVTRQLVGCSWTGAAPFQYCGSIGPVRRSDPQWSSKVSQIGNVLADKFRMTGLFGVDLIEADNQLWTLEVNPRYTAAVEIIERAYGIDAMRQHLAACTLDTDHPETKAESCQQGHVAAFSEDPTARVSEGILSPNQADLVHGKAILYAPESITILPPFVDWAIKASGQKKWPTTADIPRPGTTVRSGQPIITLFSKGVSITEVKNQLRARAKESLQILGTT